MLNKLTSNLFQKCASCAIFSKTKLHISVTRHFFKNSHQNNDKPMFFHAKTFENKTALYDTDGNYTFGNLHMEAMELSMKISRQLGGVTGERVLFLCPNDASYVITLWAIWMSGQIGVVLTHKNISTQIDMLVKAWKWTSNDVILHTLPLHHVHGTINCLFCPLSIGATTVMLPKFNVKEVWLNLLNRTDEKVNVFMAVPTIYSKLIEEYENFSKNEKKLVKETLLNNVRLMVSGSAPLPTPLFERWYEISGHKLLERYGMTEIGMCLSNLYDYDKEPGFVGLPLPTVSVAIADSETKDILFECANDAGEITFKRYKDIDGDISGDLLVKGDSVFKEYYNKPQETAKEFTKDHWFVTGDLCQYVKEKNKFKILGRSSVDIIKSGGYKISALQIETALLAHPDIKDIAVMGIPDDVYGEKILALVVKNKNDIDLDKIKQWAFNKMPKYWVPSVLKIVNEIPKNAMGKVNKKELKKTVI